jgi:hypothetical protein
VCGVAVVVWDDDVWLCVMKRDWIARFNSSIRVASFFLSYNNVRTTAYYTQRLHTSHHSLYYPSSCKSSRAFDSRNKAVMESSLYYPSRLYITGTAIEEDTQKFKISFTAAF